MHGARLTASGPAGPAPASGGGARDGGPRSATDSRAALSSGTGANSAGGLRGSRAPVQARAPDLAWPHAAPQAAALPQPVARRPLLRGSRSMLWLCTQRGQPSALAAHAQVVFRRSSTWLAATGTGSPATPSQAMYAPLASCKPGGRLGHLPPCCVGTRRGARPTAGASSAQTPPLRLVGGMPAATGRAWRRCGRGRSGRGSGGGGGRGRLLSVIVVLLRRWQCCGRAQRRREHPAPQRPLRLAGRAAWHRERAGVMRCSPYAGSASAAPFQADSPAAANRACCPALLGLVGAETAGILCPGAPRTAGGAARQRAGPWASGSPGRRGLRRRLVGRQLLLVAEVLSVISLLYAAAAAAARLAALRARLGRGQRLPGVTALVALAC